MMKLFNEIYKGKKVLVTGHSGFKGSWLVFWLQELGANVLGYSLDIPSTPSHTGLLQLEMKTVWNDVNDRDALYNTFQEFQPDIVFHLAAQALVRYSYQHPLETFETNVMGTINVFEACRLTASVKAVVNVTSDKCYENLEIDYAYKETDKLGGFDPYSASKGCAELVASSYRKSFFNVRDYGIKHNILIASVRAGNVIGGGDWALDRLVPDIIRATTEKERVQIRNPDAIRPWQHVLEPLSAYLLVGQKLLEGYTTAADAWNFGPADKETKTVGEVLMLMKKEWDDIEFELVPNTSNVHEAHLLRLDCSKAAELLCWKPVWDTQEAVKKTASWYKAYYQDNLLATKRDLENYIAEAHQTKQVWTL